ncbi:MAG: hypothetical protein KF784_15840 [Fimbriimonadaceae bacterium]|nr:hypothetical protein [Fimbriimonadaceae bacterium]
MKTTDKLISLDQVRVGSPCPTSWKEMEGDDEVRYCGLCKLNVYNLSGMSREDAEHLVNTHEGRLCIRYVQRPDGKIMTKHCPQGEIVRGRRKFALVLVSSAAFLVASMASVMTPREQKESWYQSTKEKARKIPPFKAIIDKLDPEPTVLTGQMVWEFPPHSTTP